MGNFEETFRGLLARYMRENHFLDVVTVLSYEQETRGGGYCETCYYEEIVIEVCYVDSDGATCRKDIYGDMGELIRDLSEFDAREVE